MRTHLAVARRVRLRELLISFLAAVSTACTGYVTNDGPGSAPDAGAGGGGVTLMDGGVDPGGPDGGVLGDAGDVTDPPPDADGGEGGGDPDAGPGIDPGSPGSMVEIFTYGEQHTASGGMWGDALTDIVRHLPTSYGNTYYDADFITYGHETTHGIHAHLRNNYNTTGRRANAFYLMQNRAALVVEPGIRKSAVAAYVPASLRGSRFSLYITGSSAWDDTPLYVWDEWIAYTNGGEVGTDRVRRGLWREGWRDGVAGQLEFTIYAIATGMAVEAGDPTYFRDYDQFRELLAWNARRAMDIYREGAAYEDFAWDRQDAYYEQIRTASDAADLRAWVRRVYGDAWAREVLGLD